LAIICSYLAVIGYKVRCVSYSDYLSKRDYEKFKDLFIKLGVEEDVKYGIFNEICEEILSIDGINFK
jgi:preprotein translocase subunit SecA